MALLFLIEINEGQAVEGLRLRRQSCPLKKAWNSSTCLYARTPWAKNSTYDLLSHRSFHRLSESKGVRRIDPDRLAFVFWMGPKFSVIRGVNYA